VHAPSYQLWLICTVYLMVTTNQKTEYLNTQLQNRVSSKYDLNTSVTTDLKPINSV